jgi:hypothetical protein
VHGLNTVGRVDHGPDPLREFLEGPEARSFISPLLNGDGEFLTPFLLKTVQFQKSTLLILSHEDHVKVQNNFLQVLSSPTHKDIPHLVDNTFLD